MTDKELLELASKAAGYKQWNPLTDDGDALRLAVKLNMHIHVDYDRKLNRAAAYLDGADAREEGEPDPYAATRRAIVRAAAEIGKGMK